MSGGQLPTRDIPMPLIKLRPFLNRNVTQLECEQTQYGCPVEALREALAREALLLQEKEALLAQQEILRSESDHRLLNGLQMVVSLLSLQGRSSANLDVSRQLSIAANRVAAIERIHRRLHFNDGAKTVAFKAYLDDFCRDFKGIMAFNDGAPNHVLVEGIDVLLPTTIAIPLGFIVNELITNAVKYGSGQIVVRLQAGPANSYMLSVTNEGPPLPAGYDPAASKGLGMRIIQSFVRQIGGTFFFDRGDASLGPCFSVRFS